MQFDVSLMDEGPASAQQRCASQRARDDDPLVIFPPNAFAHEKRARGFHLRAAL